MEKPERISCSGLFYLGVRVGDYFTLSKNAAQKIAGEFQ